MRARPTSAPRAPRSANHRQPELLLIGRIADRTFALAALAVERILRMVEVTALPGAPPHIAGVINLQGTLVPVVDARPLLDLAPATPDLGHRLVVLLATQRYALWMDDVERISPAQPGDFDSVKPSANAVPAPRVVRIDGMVIPVLSHVALDPGPLIQPALEFAP